MPDFGIIAGDTSKTVYLRLRDSTTGLAQTGLVFNSAGFSCYYTLPGAAAVQIALVTLASASAAWSSGGFILVSDTNAKGLYRLDLPNAAIASGAFTVISIEFDGIIEESMLIPLSVPAVNVTQWLGTAAATPTVAGVPEVDVTHLGGVAQSATDLKDFADDGYDPATKTTNNRLVLVDTTILNLISQTSFTLNAGSADDDAYNNCTIVIEDVSTAAQKAVGLISDYTGSSKTVTLKYDPAIFVMADTDKVYILAENSLKSSAANRPLDVTPNGNAGIDWNNIETPNAVNDLSGTDIQLCDTVTTNTDVRGTDSAALASVCTEGRLAELDAANLPTDVAAIPTTAMRGTDSAALASVCTEARLAELDAANLPTDVAALATSAELADGTVQVGTVQDGAIGAAAVADIFSTTNIVEAYTTDGSDGTPAQLLYDILQSLTEFAIASTTLTVKKRDGSTTAATYTLDDGTSPTSRTRAT